MGSTMTAAGALDQALRMILMSEVYNDLASRYCLPRAVWTAATRDCDVDLGSPSAMLIHHISSHAM